MPSETDRIKQAKREAKNDPSRPLPYISKSRLTTFVTCPRQFYYSYVKGIHTPTTYYMARGTQVHETYELFYENVSRSVSDGSFTLGLYDYLPGIETGHGRDEAALWADWIDPYMVNFLKFEGRRLNASSSVDKWLPVAVEAEGWLNYEYDGGWNVPFMGFADLICRSSTLDGVDADHGLTIVDFKTGKVKDEKYRDEGIYLEGEFYSLLFEDFFDEEITGVAGYYPKEDTLVTSPAPDIERRVFIDTQVNRMVDFTAEGDRDSFPIDEQPLCKWREGEENQCEFYDICESSWGTPSGPGPTYPDVEQQYEKVGYMGY